MFTLNSAPHPSASQHNITTLSFLVLTNKTPLQAAKMKVHEGVVGGKHANGGLRLVNITSTSTTATDKSLLKQNTIIKRAIHNIRASAQLLTH